MPNKIISEIFNSFQSYLVNEQDIRDVGLKCLILTKSDETFLGNPEHNKKHRSQCTGNFHSSAGHTQRK